MPRVCTGCLALWACACGINPAFDPSAGDAGGPGGATSTSEPPPVTSSTSAGSSSAGDEATTAGLSGTATSEGSSEGASEGTSEGSSDGGTTEEGTTGSGASYTRAATIATCVLVADVDSPHGGPAVCMENAGKQGNSQLKNLMMIDTSVTQEEGDGRPAHVYIRFDVPVDPGPTVTQARLYVQVSDEDTELPQSGRLVLTQAFDEPSLDLAAPVELAQLAADMGEVQPSEWLTWDIPPMYVVPGQPLYLGLFPTSDEGVELRGRDTIPGAPYLEVTVQ